MEIFQLWMSKLKCCTPLLQCLSIAPSLYLRLHVRHVFMEGREQNETWQQRFSQWRQRQAPPPRPVSEEEQFQEEHNSAAFTCRTTSTNVAE